MALIILLELFINLNKIILMRKIIEAFALIDSFPYKICQFLFASSVESVHSKLSPKCPFTDLAVSSLYIPSSTNQTLIPTLTFKPLVAVSPPTSHGSPFPVTPSSSGPHCSTHNALLHLQIQPLTLTPILRKKISPPFLTSSLTLPSLPVHLSRLRWTGPGSNLTRLCYRPCLTGLILPPNCCTRSLFGRRSGLGFNPLRRSSTP